MTQTRYTTLKILFAGGGTGGHLYPAMRLAEGLREYSQQHGISAPDIGFVGNPEGIEGTLLKDRERLFPLRIHGFHRGSPLYMLRRNSSFLCNLIRSLLHSSRIVRTFQPDIVVGTGGYVSGPPLLTATLLGIPTLIQEQNSYPGITTRLLYRFVDEIHVNYREAVDRLSKKKTYKSPEIL